MSLTKVLNIFVASKLQHDAGDAALKTTPSNVSLVYHNPVGHRGRQKRQTIGELGGGGIVVEGRIGQGVSEDGKEQGHMSTIVSPTTDSRLESG